MKITYDKVADAIFMGKVVKAIKVKVTSWLM